MKSTAAPRVPLIEGLSAIADRYDAILCDIWGVLHNGRQVLRPASDALVAFRRRGGAVVLITNAPRPNPPVREQVVRLGVSPDAFDAIVTSGDVTIALIAERAAAPVHHIGPKRDLSLLEAAAARVGERPVLVGPEEASYILCTGLFDDTTETPDDYAERLSAMAARGLTLICANPDLVVRRGADLIYCAGALAQAYEALGGKTIYAGKPHAPIYEAALAAAGAALKAPLKRSRVLAIGDAMRTDIAGAAGQGLDALFVAAGIHREAVRGSGPEAADEPLQRLFARENLWPIAAMRELAS
ncbi:MAG: TIGR01459 family HAD-type hydrolase [Roseiarcus sp.]|jgi:HAD superfamily hydrolase (TIGR01459 family)